VNDTGTNIVRKFKIIEGNHGREFAVISFYQIISDLIGKAEKSCSRGELKNTSWRGRQKAND